jgi:hypothetical protein
MRIPRGTAHWIRDIKKKKELQAQEHIPGFEHVNGHVKVIYKARLVASGCKIPTVGYPLDEHTV